MTSIEDICKEKLLIERNLKACNFFVQAVAKEIGLANSLFSGRADDIVTRMRSACPPIVFLDANPSAATSYAEDGYFVVGGLESTGMARASTSGHVFVVVPGGPSESGLDTPWGYPSRGGQPYCYHGSLSSRLQTRERLQVDFIFSRVDEGNVVYAAVKDPRKQSSTKLSSNSYLLKMMGGVAVG
ncbi:hypothetical protein [Marinimicrobium locisalis]|uniref:hypothetical protein n=1 Tax=Marinimicrobium locisalis TaxID=546022 RepID=UPI0032221CE9